MNVRFLLMVSVVCVSLCGCANTNRHAGTFRYNAQANTSVDLDEIAAKNMPAVHLSIGISYED